MSEREREGGRDRHEPYCCFHYTCAMRACEFLTGNFSCALFLYSFHHHIHSECVCMPYYNTQFWQSDYPYGQSCRNMHTYHHARVLARSFISPSQRVFNLINTQHNHYLLLLIKNQSNVSFGKCFRVSNGSGCIVCTLSILIYYNFIAQ